MITLGRNQSPGASCCTSQRHCAWGDSSPSRDCKNNFTIYSEVKNYFTLLGVRPWNYWHYKFVSKLSILVPMHGRRGTKRVRGSVLGWCGKNFTISHMSLMISCSTGDTGGEAGGESEEDDNKGEQTREIPMCTSVSLTCQCCIQFLQFRDGLRPPSSGA